MSVEPLLSSVSHLSVLRISAAAIAVMLPITGAVHAQEQEARRVRAPQPVVFTVDVAEDLAGKFVPTHS